MKRKLLPITILAVLGVSALAGCNQPGPEPIVDVTGVSLDKTTVSIVKGSTATLTATVAPEKATNSTVTWKSENSRIATVADGVVTAVDVGSTTVTVTTVDGGYTASCTVNVTLNVTSLAISNKGLFDPEYEGTDKITLEAGGLPADLKFTIVPSDISANLMLSKGYLKIASSNTTVATISGSSIYPKAAGKTTISAELFGKSDSFELTVAERKTNKQLYETVHEGDATDPFTNEDIIKVCKKMEADKSWPTNRTFYVKGEIASFADKPGVGVSSTVDGKKVYDKQLCSWMFKASESSGAKFEAYKVSILDEEGMKRDWSDADIWVGSIATIKVNALTVYKSQYESSFAECVKIEGTRPALTDIVAPTTVAVAEGDSAKITVTAKPDNAYLDPASLEFESADTEIATVDAEGKVTGVKEGKTTVTVTSGDFTKTVKIVVGEINYGTKDKPLTVEEAKEVIDYSEAGKETPKELWVSGIVSKSDYSTDYKNFNYVWLQSTDGKTEEYLELYQAKMDTGLDYKTVLKGSTVVCHGYAKNYKGTYELCPYTPQGGSKVNPVITSATGGEAEHYEEPEVKNVTLAEFISATEVDYTQRYKLSAQIKAFKEGETKDKYGNMTLKDDANNELSIYGATASPNKIAFDDTKGTYKFTNPQDFLTNTKTVGLKVGDTIQVELIRYVKNNVLNGQGLILDRNGIAGSNASATGTEPESTVAKLELDFSSGTINGITATSSSSPTAEGIATIGDYEFNFAAAIAHAESNYITPGYLGLCSKGGSKVSFFANKTAIPGKILKVEFTMPSDKTAGSGSVSALAPFVVEFGTAALGATELTGGQTGGSGVSFSAFPAGETSYSFFSISCVKGVGSTGSATWYNGYISSITIYYLASN